MSPATLPWERGVPPNTPSSKVLSKSRSTAPEIQAQYPFCSLNGAKSSENFQQWLLSHLPTTTERSNLPQGCLSHTPYQ